MYDDKRCVLVVDDEVKIVRALKDFFTINSFHVLTAYDGAEALEVFYEHNTDIDIILLDVMMPKIDGFAVLEEIRETSLVPVIMLTAKGEEYDQIQGFKSGADDYIPKPFSPSLLMARVDAVLRRVGKDQSSEVVCGDLRLNRAMRTVKLHSEVLDLTPKEFDLLDYFMINRGLPLSRDQILNAVWGYDFDGDIRTVDTHIKQLRGKLGDYAAAIKTMYRVGYQFSPEV